MKVIFIQNVAKQGKIGEIKEVATGFATNVLIPKKQAILATPQAIKKLIQEKEAKEYKEEVGKSLFLQSVNNLQNKLDKESEGLLKIADHKKDKDGNLFSQVKDIDIVNAIYKILKISFNKDQIVLPKEPIKKVGEYEIELKDKVNTKSIKIKII